jgi:tripartite-type tricarboxylate transporter receptor subunit TctC
MSGWNMLFAPAGTPRPVVERLNRALLEVLREENVARRMGELGSVPAGGDGPRWRARRPSGAPRPHAGGR